MAASVTAPWPRRARPATSLLAVAYGIVALLVVAAGRAGQSYGPTSYAGGSTLAYTADLVAGLGLLGAAAVALADGGAASVGVLALATGLLWFAPDWEGWAGGPTFFRSLGSLAVPLLAAPLALFVADRRLVRLGAAVLVAAAILRVLVRDPLFDPYCWRDCLSSTFVADGDPTLARDLDRVWQITAIALASVAIPAALARPRRGTALVVVPAALALAAVAAYAVQLLHDPQESPRDGTFHALFYVRALALAALAVGITLTIVRRRRQRAAVARLADDLSNAPEPGHLNETLAAAFGDPTLDVAYWLPQSSRFVDTRGEPVDAPAATAERAATPIVRGGRPIAVVAHDPALLGESFERELGSAARLAVENERLQAEVRAQLVALRRSRLRITTRGDAERRRLERNLHDGAQQRLLALGYDLRLARAAAVADGDEALATELAAATNEAQSALEELRQLAHGIYPAVLAEAGLAAALETLADEAPLAVELARLPSERFDADVEAALYAAAREAIGDAVRRGATWVRVALDGRVRLRVEDDGEPRAASLVHVADRVGALGGETTFGGNTLEAAIPCE